MSFYARYEDVPLPEGIDAGATVIYWTESEDAWFWFIPLSDRTVSIGFDGDWCDLLGYFEGDSADLLTTTLFELPVRPGWWHCAVPVDGTRALVTLDDGIWLFDSASLIWTAWDSETLAPV